MLLSLSVTSNEAESQCQQHKAANIFALFSKTQHNLCPNTEDSAIQGFVWMHFYAGDSTSSQVQFCCKMNSCAAVQWFLLNHFLKVYIGT